MNRRVLFVVALAVGIAVAFCDLALPSTSVAGEWETITKESGIVVKKKDEEGRDLPIFRGTTVIPTSVIDVIGVISDSKNVCKWMHRCAEARMLKEINDLERIVYNKVDSPWPVSDRDVVLRAKLKVDMEKKRVIIRFRNIKSNLVPENDDVVRMPRLVGFYILDVLGPEKTRVTYQVDADPGGLLPDWLIASASKDLPLVTLRNLRKRCIAMKDKYDDFVKGRMPGEVREAGVAD